MNIFLHKKQFLLLFLLYLYFPLAGQQVDTVVYANPGEPINFSFSHFNESTIGINLLQAPSNGELVGPDVVIDAHLTYEFTYQPNPDFLGLDIFTFTRIACPTIFSCLDTMVVLVEVREPTVDAKQDIAFAMLNSGPIEIDVLKNDQSESGDLEIANIPMVNNGEVLIDAEGKLFFQPTPGFQGIASFNYNACNDYGTCDMATVNIVVNDVLPGESDTLRIFTSINEPIPILTPSDYNLDETPENGVFEQFNVDLPLYTPDNDFVGKDYISFSYGAFAQTVEVNVMNYLKNQFLVNDKAYVTPGQSIEIDIFSNDDLNGFPCLESLGQPKYGSITIDQENSGILTYRAPADFVGIDEFEYAAKDANCQGAVETAKVSVFVSKYEPAAAKYEMSTPKMTPLVIGYYVPIQNFELKIKQQPRLGKLQFLAGKVDTLIYGRQITGENLMIYWPSQDLESATDEFEVTYCLKGQANTGSLDFFSLGGSDCAYEKDVKIQVDILDIGNGETPLCFGDCIWSGDTNFDGIVNLEDLLPIGQQMGQSSAPREDLGFTDWFGEEVTSEVSSVKHIDTDGDGLVTSADTAAINAFFGRTHSMTNAKIPTYDYQIYLKGNSTLRPGDMFELDIYIGSEDAPAIDLYGFLFNLPYNTRFFKPESMEIDFAASSWMTYNSPTLDMANNDGQGRLSAAFTRTNQIAVSGFGKVGTMRGVVEDVLIIKDADGKIEIEISDLLGTTATNGSGDAYGVKVAPFTITIDLEAETQPEEEDDDESELDPLDPGDLLLYPNPVQDRLNLYLNGGRQIDRVQLFDLNGRLLIDSGRIGNRAATLAIPNVSDGLYLAKIFSDNQLISRKVQITKALGK